MPTIGDVTLGEAVSSHPLASAVIFILLVLAAAFFLRRRGRKSIAKNLSEDGTAAAPFANDPAAAAKSPAKVAGGGELSVLGVGDRTLALLLAVVAEKSGADESELQIVSVKRIGNGANETDIELENKYPFEIGGGLPEMKYKITLNDNVYEVEVKKSEAAVSAPSGGPPPEARGDGKALKAPLSGTVIDIPVSVGDTVKTGQVLLILEAMKMENEIVAPGNFRVTRIFVSKGGAVKTGDPLFALE